MTWGPPSSIAQGMLDAVADGRRRGDRRAARARRGLGRSGRRRRDGGARREPRGDAHKAIGDCVERAIRPLPPSPSSATSSLRNPTTPASEDEISGSRPRYRYLLDPPFLPPGIRFPRTHRTRRSSSSAPTTAVEGYASGDGVPDATCSNALLRSRRLRNRRDPRDLRDGRLPPRAQMDVEVAVWDLSAAPAASRCGASSGIATGSHPRVRFDWTSSSSGGTPAVVDGPYAMRARAKIRLHSEDWQVDPPVLEAGPRGCPRDRRHGRREPGLAHAGRPDPALEPRDSPGVRGRARSEWTSTGSRSPLPTEDITPARRWRDAACMRIAAGEMVVGSRGPRPSHPRWRRRRPV